MLANSSVLWSMDSAVAMLGEVRTSAGVLLASNVIYESYDVPTVDVQTTGNTIRGNLALGTIKVGTGGR